METKCVKKYDNIACDCYTEGVNDSAKYIKELQKEVESLKAENKIMKDILIPMAKGSHKNKALYEWWCKEGEE